MKVLLVNPPNNMDEFLGKGAAFVNKSMPFGLVHIYTYLAASGFDVEYADCFNYGLTMTQLKRRIEDRHSDIIGISSVTANGEPVFRLGQWIKNKFPDTLVVLGNIHPSTFDHFYLRHGAADLVVHGEGELTMAEVVRAHAAGDPWEGVAGISFLRGGEVVRTADRPLCKDLDQFPTIYCDLLDHRLFHPVPNKAPFFLLTSRGCVNRCKFCVAHHKSYRWHSSDRVISEMLYIKKRYNKTFYAFLDPLFTGSQERVLELCDRMGSQIPEARWSCAAHFRSSSEKLLRAMRKAGCYRITFGVESGNDEILKSMGKRIDTARAREGIEMAKRLGFHVEATFMVGYEGETPDTIEDTINFARGLPLDEAQFSTFTPYPGSYLYEEFIKDATIRFDFSDVEDTLKKWRSFNSYTIFNDEIKPIYAPSGMSVGQLQKLQKRAMMRFYLRPKYMLKFALATMRTNNYLPALRAGLQVLK